MQLDNLENDSVLKNYTVGLARIYVDNFGDYNSALYNDLVGIQKYIAELITSQHQGWLVISNLFKALDKLSLSLFSFKILRSY